MIDGPFRGFVELPRAVFEALRDCLEVVVEHELKERERTRFTPRRPLLLDVLESDPIAYFWRGMAPKAQLRWLRLADRAETAARARCICGQRKAEVTVTDHVFEDCHEAVTGQVIAKIMERLAAGVHNCHCVVREP